MTDRTSFTLNLALDLRRLRHDPAASPEPRELVVSRTPYILVYRIVLTL